MRVAGGLAFYMRLIGVVGAIVEDTKLEEMFCCGVGKGHSRFRIFHNECLDLAGRLLRMQHSMSSFLVVWVRDPR